MKIDESRTGMAPRVAVHQQAKYPLHCLTMRHRNSAMHRKATLMHQQIVLSIVSPAVRDH